MVANLSAHKRGWDDKWEEYSLHAEQGQEIMHKLLKLVDEDTKAFDAIIQAMRLPKSSEQDQNIRKQAIEKATRNAIEVPLKVMKVAFSSMNILKEMSEKGLSSSISDVGVGIACARTAVLGAYLNVKINCQDMADKKYVAQILAESEQIKDEAIALESRILEHIENKIDN
jgi:glutamate formiminotransferase/formiminotetrahydrofolate cyclodeaminase